MFHRNTIDIDFINIIATIPFDELKLAGIYKFGDFASSEASVYGKEVYKHTVYRDNDPVSVFSLQLGTGEYEGMLNASVFTRGEDAYRRKGYATVGVQNGIKWYRKHSDKYKCIVWWVRKDNLPSIKLAEKCGFILDKSSVLDDNPWIMYRLE